MLVKKLVLSFQVKDMQKIVICSAMILSPVGNMLMVRKKGSKYFQLPGGKITAGEAEIEALLRELDEELHLDAKDLELRFMGVHTTEAVNERDTLVEGRIYAITLQTEQSFSPQAELEEIVWVEKEQWQNYQFARLAAEFVVPKWLSGGF
jgi:8-oxo-dGTP diphosphatase